MIVALRLAKDHPPTHSLAPNPNQNIKLIFTHTRRSQSAKFETNQTGHYFACELRNQAW